MATKEKYIIVGGGLSGLSLAYELSKKGNTGHDPGGFFPAWRTYTY